MLEISAMRKLKFAMKISAASAALALVATPALAQDVNPAEPALIPPADQSKPDTAVPPVEVPVIVQPVWKVAHAEALLNAIKNIGEEGLKPADYQPDKLSAAIAGGESTALDVEFVRAFTWLVEDLRDGRTPMKSRVQWFVEDTDIDTMPTSAILAKVMATGDVAGTLKSLDPAHTDFAALRKTLAATPADQVTKRRLIAANMDRWRWLKRDLGKDYLHTNVPEYMLRYVVNKQQIATYRTVVGKPGNTATPQLAEMVQGVIFNPTWTVPQSIVKGEGLGAKVLANPSWGASRGYKATKGPNGYVTVVQKPGPTNSLGYMKLDMPNPHAIFLHDTPSRHLFNSANRALSHGCVRTEDAMALAMAIALVQGEVPVTKSKEIIKSLEYTRVPVKNALPVYITYFTMATSVDGKLQSFGDVYARDKPVFDALAAARPIRAGRMKRNTDVVVIKRPGA
jgi:L,D-transpeptidase YcbB